MRHIKDKGEVREKDKSLGERETKKSPIKGDLSKVFFYT
jgi:hypothetical protein